MENQMNVSDQNTQQIGQNSVNQQPISPEKPKSNSLMIAGTILVCFILFGSAGYYVGRQPSKENPKSADGSLQKPTSELISQTDQDFLKKIENIYSFRDSKNNLRRIVIIPEGDQKESDDYLTVYLANDVIDKSSLIKITKIGMGSMVTFGHSSSTGRVFFYLFLNGPGEYQEIILADENGKIISLDVIEKNAKKIGLGTVIQPQYYISIQDFFDLESGNILSIFIDNAIGEKYQAQIDAVTGNYVEGSRQKVK